VRDRSVWRMESLRLREGLLVVVVAAVVVLLNRVGDGSDDAALRSSMVSIWGCRRMKGIYASRD
jgi:hypothetical protein